MSGLIAKAAGTYTISAQSDTMGCVAAPVTVVIAPRAVVTSSVVSSTNPSCYGGSDGSIQVSASGGSGSYLFSLNGGVWASGTTPHTFGSLASGTYTIRVRDTNSCAATPLTATLTDPAPLVISTSTTEPQCYVAQADGSITVQATGRSGLYTYTLSGNSITPVILSSPTSSVTFAGLASGTYSVLVTFTSGSVSCTNTTSVTVSTPSCYCALSQGYWKTHQSAWQSSCPSTPGGTCADWCGGSFSYYLNTPPRGNALIIAGKQFAAFVLNWFFYNAEINIRTTPLPGSFNQTIATAFETLKNGCGLPTAQLLYNAAILESFNSHNSTVYPWLAECDTTVRSRTTKDLIKQFKK